jgi:hypothetical protein
VIANKYLANSQVDTNGKQFIEVTHRKRNELFDGRVHADGSLSMQTISKNIRQLIGGELYVDVDMENAHPTIYSHVCRTHNVRCPIVDDYVENREGTLRSLVKQCGGKRGTMKKVILAIMNGGDLEHQIKSNKLKSCDWLVDFNEEIKSSTEAICKRSAKRYRTYYNNLVENDNEPERRPKYRYVNNTMCEWESKALRTIIDTFKKDGYCGKDGMNYVPCFDGVMVLKSAKLTSALNNGYLQTLEQAVKTRYCLPIKLACKPMDEPLELEDGYICPPYVFDSTTQSKFVEERRLDEFKYVYAGMPIIAEQTVKVRNKTTKKMEIQYTKNQRFKVVAVEDTNVLLLGGMIVPITDLTRNFRPAYAVTSHKAQGSTITERYVIHEFEKLSKHGRYVALTRTINPRNIRVIM